MRNDVLDKFGESLMVNVRDYSITQWNKTINGQLKGKTAQRIRPMISELSGDQKEILLSLVPEIVDTVLHHLLVLLEQDEDINVEVAAEGERMSSLREASDGLAGELYTEDGWIARFSRQIK